MRTSPPLLAPLFRSEGQARLLAALLLPDAVELSVSELARRAGLTYSAVHREVGRLQNAGLLVSTSVGNVRLVRVDLASPLAGPVREILTATYGPIPLLIQQFDNIGGIDVAFIFGSYAARVKGRSGPSPNDIDVMVIGDPDPLQVYEACRTVEDVISLPTNATIMSWLEWGQGSAFVKSVKDAPVVPLIGDLPWQSRR